jgi:hypothetical protein
MSGRTLDLNLHLLDRQVVDRDAKLVCKVDDLEFERGSDGALYVVAILVGPRALAARLRGRIGTWVASIAGRIAEAEVPRIDMSLVSDIDSEIKLGASRDELGVAPLEDWVREHVIVRIPGNGHASE